MNHTYTSYLKTIRTLFNNYTYEKTRLHFKVCPKTRILNS